VFIVRNGWAIWQGPECDRDFPIFSATKSFTSTMLGLLIDDGRVTLDTFAQKFEPVLAEQYPNVTLRHFATMTSGYDSAVAVTSSTPRAGAIRGIPVRRHRRSLRLERSSATGTMR